MKVQILLATYNGEKYIEEQLNSLLSQTYNDFQILIRDDGSTDKTVSIIKNIAKKNEDKIIIIEDNINCGNPTANFMQLMKNSDADYVMFCDQDDIWYPNKVEKSLECIKTLENKDTKVPCLIYTDYRVVGDDLNYIDKSNTQLDFKKLDFSHLLVQNYVTGCCMMINKALCQIADNYDNRILMHDWWLALCAAGGGRIEHFPIVLMDYRQHIGQNAGFEDISKLNYIFRKIFSSESRKSMCNYINQAEALREKYYENLNSQNKLLLQIFLNIPKKKSKLKRIQELKRYEFVKNTTIRQLSQYWYI